ncbi:Uncharacterised protein [Mycobacteroides abscessus subsp. abscessus]|nr:Uncharacterised protein [Mycobacteroides abscessus subsp. abscessus]
MTAATHRPMSKAEPADRAAGARAAKIPAPIIEPNPIMTASKVPNSRRSAPGGWLLMRRGACT